MMTRRAALALVAQGPQKHCELERALILRLGLVTLSEGTKVDTLPDNERLLGGAPPLMEDSSQIQVFDSIISKATSLQLPSCRGQALTTCKEIHEGIETLIACSKKDVHEISLQVEQEKQKLIASMQSYTNLSTELRTSEARLSELRVREATLIAKKEEITKAIEALNIETIQEKIGEEKTKRSNAALHLIPGAGFVKGLATGDFKHWIPFYAGIQGLDSVFSQKKESLEKELARLSKECEPLNEEIKSVSLEREKQTELINQLQKELNRINSEISVTDNATKQIGKQLTDVQNIRKSLCEIQIKYKFLSWDISTIEDFIEKGIKVDLVSAFLQDVKTAQASFLTWKERKLLTNTS